MSQYLINTNILSEPIKPQPNPKVIETMQRNTKEIVIASITWYEIRFGCNRLPPSRKRESIEQYLQDAKFSMSAKSTYPKFPPAQVMQEAYGDRQKKLEQAERFYQRIIGYVFDELEISLTTALNVNEIP